MISVIEALYDGRVIPWEHRVIMTPERKAVEKRIECEKQYFTERMSPDDGERFEQLENLYVTANCHEEVDIYSYGFTLGVTLMLEVLGKVEGMINE